MLKKIFKVDNTFYPKDKIQEIIPLFEDYGITYSDSGELEITSESDSPEEIFDEFMNYLLAYLNE